MNGTTCRHYHYAPPAHPHHLATLQANEGPQCRLGRVLQGVGCVRACIDPQHASLCPDRATFTAEEIASDKADSDAMVIRVLTAAAHLESLGVKPGESGKTTGPTCGAALHYARAGSNGHWRVKCDTLDCVSLLQ